MIFGRGQRQTRATATTDNKAACEPVSLAEAANVCAGDIVLVQGTSPVSRIIRWATNCRYSHTGMICCKLSNGELLVYEMLAPGTMIRPLRVYKGIRVDIMRVVGTAEVNKAESGIVRMLDNRADYNFVGVLYLGLVLIPKRMFTRPGPATTFPPDIVRRKTKPRNLYEWICLYVIDTFSAITFMDHWSAGIRFVSRDKWLAFTDRVFGLHHMAKQMKGEVTFQEFVNLAEIVYSETVPQPSESQRASGRTRH